MDPLNHLESFYEECRVAEPSLARPATPPFRWLNLVAAFGIGVAATLVVAFGTPKPRTDESAAAQYLQEAQLAQRDAKEVARWRG
jgi:hypothetical protein